MERDSGQQPRWSKHQSWARRRARRLLGPHLRSEMDSQDLAQASFAEAWQARSCTRFDSPWAFRAWLSRVMGNLAVKAARRADRQQGGLEPDELAGRSSGSPSARMRGAERLGIARSLLKRLETREREVVTLRVVEDLSFREVGRRVGVSEGNARVIFSRSIKKLRELPGHDADRA